MNTWSKIRAEESEEKKERMPLEVMPPEAEEAEEDKEDPKAKPQPSKLQPNNKPPNNKLELHVLCELLFNSFIISYHLDTPKPHARFYITSKFTGRSVYLSMTS